MPVDQARLARTLNPRNVVVVGDKGPAFMWLESNKNFTGELYSVQLDPKEVEQIEARGFRNYAKITDVPEDEIDLVICAVPRNVTPFILKDAVEKNVAGIHFFTAGFAETGDEQGIKLQEHIVETARQTGLVVIGPNCMGIYNRRLGVKFSPDLEHGQGGNVSFIAQSGTHAVNMTLLAQQNGMSVTRAVSMGNAVVTNESDLLEFYVNDPDTDIIGIYMEGMKDGPRFFKTLREATKRKPVVIWKGGLTEAGARATSSHTASLATPAQTWTAMARQAGAISVYSVDEMTDVVSILARVPEPRGRNLALLAMTGGQSVAISDAFNRAGMKVPMLSAGAYERLAEFFNVIGGSFRNPFDMAGTIGMSEDGSALVRIMDILAEEPVIDAAVFEFSAGFFVRRWKENPEMLKQMLDTLDGFRERTRLPMITILHPYHQEEAVRPVRQELIERGYAVFPNFERGATALARVNDYYEWRRGI